uniref:Kazal-like domain-containing protein n=1 Tax=Heliothis virescens TaxID=7102 RepID=A0A2A4K303_HELVI
MLFEILVALTCILVSPVMQHYIGNLDDCTLSKVCNHTWVPLCGRNIADESYRMFLDKCDLHEYNCIYNTSYVEEDSDKCGKKCTHNETAYVATTTPMTPTTEAKTTELLTEQAMKTKLLNINKTNTSLFLDQSALEIEEATTPMINDTNQTDNVSTVEPANIEDSVALQTEITTESTTTTESPTTIEPVTNSEPATNATPPINDRNSTKDYENTIPGETQPTTATTTTPAKINSSCYPKQCFAPSTWETTQDGETRDFVQILKERFGDRLNILRHTSRYPKPANYVRRHMFIRGRHVEDQ